MTPLRPEIVEYVQKKQGNPRPGEIPVDEFRAAALPDPEVQGPKELVHSIEDIFIPGPTAYLPVRIYRPSSASNLPALIYFHGGGWVLSSVDHYDVAMRSLANKIGCVVIAVNYQKAPEHRFPIPFNDCYATYEWVFDNAENLGLDTSKIGIGGDSAGGNLAAAVALCARDAEAPEIAFQLLVYPCTDYQYNTESGDLYAEGFGLDRDVMEYFVVEYVNREDRNHPYAFPAHATSFEGVAPAIVCTAEYDILRDDGASYVEKLAAARVPVNYLHFDDLNHGSWLYGGLGDFTESMHRDVAAAVKQQLGL